MGKVNIKLNGADTVVDAIRYLEENGKDFFVYTLSELDNQAYQISYVTKVENGKGIVLTEDEWNQIKELIKRIVRESKLAQDNIIDKDFGELEGLEVTYAKPFKLPMSSTNLLRVQVIPETKIEVEIETDKDPVISESYTFEEEKKDEELPKLEPSKLVSFDEFEEPIIETDTLNNSFEEKIDINNIEEMSLSELPEPEPIQEPDYMAKLETENFEDTVVEEPSNNVPKDNFEELIKEETADEENEIISDVEKTEDETPVEEDSVIESVVSSNKTDETVTNLEHMKTELEKHDDKVSVVSKELADPTFKTINPFEKVQEEHKGKGLISGLYSSLFERKEKEHEEELKPVDVEQYKAPKQEKETTIDYKALESEIELLRKQIEELSKKVG